MEEQHSIPLPTRLDAAGWEWPMTGRVAELETLRRGLSAAAGGDRRFVLIGGEPGIGKTRLASQFATEAHASGSTVLLGGTSEGLAKPYLPFVEAFGECLDQVPPDLLAGSGGELAELGRLVPESAELLGQSAARADSPASEQFALFKAALSLLRLIPRAAPLVLVLEGLHWADKGTLLMLHYLLTGRGGFQGLIVATYRQTDVAPGAPLTRLLSQLGREPGFERIELDGLSDEEILSLLGDVAGPGLHGHDRAVAATLRRETGGNPFLASELIRSLLSSGALTEVEGRWRLREGVADSSPLRPVLVESIDQRARALGPDAAEALSLAAVAGESFDPTRIEAALGRESGKLASVWVSAERAGLLSAADEPPWLGFRQPLVRRTLCASLGAGQRALLERRLEAVGDSPIGGETITLATLERRGEHWAIGSARGEIVLKDSKGIRYLAQLLSVPGVEMHAVDLQGLEAADGRSRPPAAMVTADLGMQGASAGDAGPVLDETAKRRYRDRIDELEAEIEEAEGFNDPERAAGAREELDFIGRELAAAVGLGGRDRRAASEAERARVNVTRAIRSALDRIEGHDEVVGGQLRAALRTGAFCCYEPVPGQRIHWQVRA